MGTFIIKKTNTGFNFSLLAANKVKIAIASQVYASVRTAKIGMASIAKNAAFCIENNKIADSTLDEPTTCTCPRFEVYTDKAGLYRFRLIATNGESIAICEQGYKTKSGVLNGIKSVAVNAVDAEVIDETVAPAEDKQ